MMAGGKEGCILRARKRRTNREKQKFIASDIEIAISIRPWQKYECRGTYLGCANACKAEHPDLICNMIPRELGSHLFQLGSKSLTHFNYTEKNITRGRMERTRRGRSSKERMRKRRGRERKERTMRE